MKSDAIQQKADAAMIALVACLCALADEHAGGHFTIMRFTTNWRVGLHTVNSHDDVDMMYDGSSMEAAIVNLLEGYGVL